MLERPLEIKEGWVGFLDIYGFSAWLFDADLSQTANQLSTFHLNLEAYAAKESDLTGATNILFMTDSIVVATEFRDDADKTFKLFSKSLEAISNISTNSGYILRGFCTYGKFSRSSYFIHGEAYVRAFRTQEKQQILPTIVTSEDELLSAGLLNTYKRMLRPAQFKSLQDVNKRDDVRVLQLAFPNKARVKSILLKNLARIEEMDSYSSNQKDKYESGWMTLMETI